MKKIITVVGARPQFIKAAALSREIKKYSNKIKEVIVHTGQHFDENMSDVFFETMDIPKPDYNLDINSKSHSVMTAEMMMGLEKIFNDEKPDLVLVYGDTNSTLSAALVASKMHIKIAHIEAGMRSFNKKIPEEVNRVLCDHISNMFFCASDVSVKNLKNENIVDNVFCVGDIMFDTFKYYSNKNHSSQLLQTIGGDIILCTIHREDNTNNLNRLSEIISSLQVLSKSYEVVLPLHPRTKKIIENNNIPLNGIKVIEPVGYFDILGLLKKSKIVITDSGGLQKEAVYAGKNVVIIRNETEWDEILTNNVGVLVGSNFEEIPNIVETYKFSKAAGFDAYGSGNTAQLICEKILSFLSK